VSQQDTSIGVWETVNILYIKWLTEVKQQILYLSILLQAVSKRLCTTQSFNNATNCSFFFHLPYKTICFGPRWPSSGVLIY
jgi:hypothetical protein